MLLDWYSIGMHGGQPDMPAKGYTWKTLRGLNKEIWEQYRSVNLDTVKDLLNTSYADAQKLIINHTEEEIFEKNTYTWTGSTPLGGYLISNTSSHYAWAIKLIKKSLK